MAGAACATWSVWTPNTASARHGPARPRTSFAPDARSYNNSHGARCWPSEPCAESLQALGGPAGKRGVTLFPCTPGRAALCHLHQRQGLGSERIRQMAAERRGVGRFGRNQAVMRVWLFLRLPPPARSARYPGPASRRPQHAAAGHWSRLAPCRADSPSRIAAQTPCGPFWRNFPFKIGASRHPTHISQNHKS